MKEVLLVMVAAWHAIPMDSKYILVQLQDELEAPRKPPVENPDEPNAFLAGTKDQGKHELNS